MSVIIWICAPLALSGLITLACCRPWVDRRARRSRLSRRHRRAWEAIRGANKDVAATGAYIAACEERGHPQ